MARCQWCTAPLPPGGATCSYCGRRNDVDLNGIHEFTTAVPESARICPACGIPMQTLDLRLGGTFYIERCERCLSLFFDPNEIETVLEKSSAETFEIDRQRLDQLAQVRGAANGRIRYYQCPVCRTAMNRVNFGSRSGVIIDRCPAHGVWLESGELRRLLEWRKAGGQVLDQQRKVERADEERKKEARRMMDAYRTAQESGAFAEERGGVFGRSADPTEAVWSLVKTVFRLFR